MRNAEDTPPDGFARLPWPLPHREPGGNRPDRTARAEAEALAGDPASRYPAPSRAHGLRPPDAPPAAVASRPAPRPAPPTRRRPAAAALAQLPYLLVLAGALAGIWWAWRGSHDVGNGAGAVGGALLAAAIARLVLPQSAAGLLASRRRFADVLALGTLGAGLLVLALVLPPT